MKSKYLLVFLVLGFCASCGVKGRPLPPLQSPAIGRGTPTFSGRSDRVSLDELDRKRKEQEEPEVREGGYGPSEERGERR